MQVTDLRAQLGDSALPCPTMDIGSSFTTIINKALNIDGFFPYNTDLNFLLGKDTAACPQFSSKLLLIWGAFPDCYQGMQDGLHGRDSTCRISKTTYHRYQTGDLMLAISG